MTATEATANRSTFPPVRKGFSTNMKSNVDAMMTRIPSSTDWLLLVVLSTVPEKGW